MPLRFIAKCSVFYVNSSNDNIIYYHFKILFIIKSKTMTNIKGYDLLLFLMQKRNIKWIDNRHTFRENDINCGSQWIRKIDSF